MMAGYVYLLQEIDFDGTPSRLYKIGKTSLDDIEKRKKQYKAGNARQLKTYARVSVADPQYVETELHRHFDTLRIKNNGGGDEWFYFENPQTAIDQMNSYGASNFKPTCYQIPEQEKYAPQRESANRDYDYGVNLWPIVPWVASAIGLLAFLGVAMNSLHETKTIAIPPSYDVANIRSKPDGKIINRLGNGIQVETTGNKTARWCEISQPEPGWIACEFLK